MVSTDVAVGVGSGVEVRVDRGNGRVVDVGEGGMTVPVTDGDGIAVGVLIGVGFYGAATTAAILAVVIMSGLRWLEKLLPHQFLENLTISYPRDKVASEEVIRALVRRHGFEVVEWAYQVNCAGNNFEFNLILSQLGVGRSDTMAAELTATPDVLAFRLSQSRN